MTVVEDFENWHCFQTYPFPDDNYDEFYEYFCGFSDGEKAFLNSDYLIDFDNNNMRKDKLSELHTV